MSFAKAGISASSSRPGSSKGSKLPVIRVSSASRLITETKRPETPKRVCFMKRSDGPALPEKRQQGRAQAGWNPSANVTRSKSLSPTTMGSRSKSLSPVSMGSLNRATSPTETDLKKKLGAPLNDVSLAPPWALGDTGVRAWNKDRRNKIAQRRAQERENSTQGTRRWSYWYYKAATPGADPAPRAVLPLHKAPDSAFAALNTNARAINRFGAAVSAV